MFLLLYGFFILIFTKVWAQCNTTSSDPLDLTAGPYPQYFISPNYPDRYDDNMDCYWLISAPSTTERVVINIHETNVNGSSGCIRDYINVYDGATNDSSLLATVCDQNEDTYNMFVSSGQHMYIWFHADDNGNERGFRILYFSNDTGIQEKCDGVPLVATYDTQYLMSANLPNNYTSDYNCTTYIETDMQFFTLEITLYLLDVEESKGCVNDQFTIGEGQNTSVITVLDTLCTTAFEYTFDVVSTQYSVAAISLVTDSAATNYYGFLLGYKQIHVGVNLTYPDDGETVTFSIREDQQIGSVNATLAKVEVTSTGVLSVQLLQDNAVATDFDIVQENDTYIIETVNILDHETQSIYLLTVIVTDDVNPSLSATVYFNVSVRDVDDIPPTITNLPGNATVHRSDIQGLSVYNITTTDGDATSSFQIPQYSIFAGNSDGLIQIDVNTGEITLAQPASIISITQTSYSATVAAYSVSLSSGLASFASFALYFHPDAPPNCTHVTVLADNIGSSTHGAGSVLTFASPWNCSDEGTIVYSIDGVSPNVSLFVIDNTTGLVSLTRSFDLTEVPTRQFNISVSAEDFLGQTTTFNILINVSTLQCYPNPRQIYVRSGDAIGSTVIDDYNCTSTGLYYSINVQHPPDTFGISGSSLILQAEVFKIRYYSLTLRISDGTDIFDLTFKVTIRMRRCNSMLSTAVIQHMSMYFVFCVVLTGFKLRNIAYDVT